MIKQFKVLFFTIFLIGIAFLFNFNKDGSKYSKAYIISTYNVEILYKQVYSFNVTILKQLNNILNNTKTEGWIPEESNIIPQLNNIDDYVKNNDYWVFRKSFNNNNKYLIIYLTEGTEFINNKKFKIYLINKTVI